MIEQFLIYLLSFIGFCLIQSFFINGVHEAFKGSAIRDDVNKTISYQGNILYMIMPRFLEKYKHRYWAKNLWTCVKCLSSTYGALTFWPTVIYLFGFKWEEIFIYIIDVFVLVTLNWIVYKKL